MSKNTRYREPIYDADPKVARNQKEQIDNDPGLRHRIVRAQVGNCGKGDRPRLVDQNKYRNNYDMIKWKSKK
jgi:hypothetical protein